ncbi:erythromycin esterase family protein [Pseudomonas sp. SWRI153]|uniref:Erythromycin esterase family protein n=1 Tax=Pseudomonas khorasanensis TaxID=2745508 RepID=A0A923EZ40_9PSED|nr:erythromycin esterase family protein [Pseudomonas khorasanensis]MBV4484466.1 erythromycin esterase family protein [Pseudomonas khorasanensis]
MDTLATRLKTFAEPLPDIDSEAFAELFDRYADAQVVLIGEASHGTHEFYAARAAITRHLIAHHGFTIVAVEADWPDADQIDRHVRDRRKASRHDTAFSRFPTWMWRNTDVQAFTRWLHEHNRTQAPTQRVEFRGLDVYSLRSSIREVLGYLQEADPAMAREAQQRYACLTPWHDDPALYGHFTEVGGMDTCESAVLEQLQALLSQRLSLIENDGEALFNATQNARVVHAAEQYYRAMYRGSRESWNLRDRHMFETLQTLRTRQASDAKVIVWAHNSHIGDARATQMGNSGQLTLGQLCREEFAEQAVLIGMGTDRGTVAAADDWDAPMRIKKVVPALPRSWERAFAEAECPQALYDWRDADNIELRETLAGRQLERAIGVIYRPQTERQSHYFDATLSEQFDAWLWFAETTAITPLPTEQPTSHEEDTFPFGL